VPFDIARLVGPFDAVWHRRRAAWLDHAGIDSEGQGSWENAIAWRLAQDYQMRWSPDDEQPQMWGQIQRLLPVMEEQAVAGGIKRVARLALPSILESLMRGSGGRGNANGRDLITARSDGLRALEPYGRDIFAERSQRLTFQHRMHPDISAMPRRLFYQDEALKDAKGMATSRAWSCDCFGDYRSVWVPVAGTERNNRNEREAQALLQQLTRFLRWAETQPHKDGNGWEVAILTFYRGQEDLLRRCLDRSAAIRIGYGAYIHRNALGRDAASIKLCTVDRFQGHEADVVFLSFVKTRSVGFLRCLNRLNVAITRARYQLVLVGDRDFFGNTQRDSRLLRELATLPAKTTETK